MDDSTIPGNLLTRATEAQLRAADLPPVQYVCGLPLYPVGGCVFIYGAPGVGKSFIQQGLNHTITWGKPAGSFSPEITANVLYADFEGNANLVKERSLALTPHGQLASDTGGARMPTDTVYLFSDHWKGQTFAERLAELVTELEAQEARGIPYSLIVLDTFTAFVGANKGKKNAYDHDVEAINALNTIAARYQVCIVLIHHPNKAGEMSGSTGRSGSAWMVMHFKLLSEGEAILSMDKNRVGPVYEFAFSWDRNRIWRLASDLPVKVAIAKGNHRAVLTCLAEKGPATRAELLEMTGMPKGSIDWSLNRLAARGDVHLRDGRWCPAFERQQDMPIAPVWKPWPNCGTCRCKVDPDYGCVNSACPTRTAPPAAAESTLRIAPPPPAAAPTPVQRKRSTLPTLTLDTDGLDPDEPKKGAIKASMALMKQSVQRDTARYHPSLFAAQPELDDKPWEGRPKWTEPGIGDEVPLLRLDKNAAYLSAANTKLPVGPLKEDDDPEKAYRDGRVGYHRITVPETAYSCGGPFHTRTERGPVWITTPTLKQILAHGPVPILASHTAPGTEVLLRPWIDVLKAQRAEALKTGDQALYAFVKNCYSLVIATMGESNANWELRRPDWMHIIRAQAYANLWRKAVQAQAAGVTVAAVRNTDEIWVVADDTARRAFEFGTGLGQWKIKAYRADGQWRDA